VAEDTLAALQATIAALQAQRALLGDVVVDTALAPLREKLAALQAATPTGAEEPQLRHCAVLFLDVVGSTQLSQQLDPEQVQAVMDGALRRFAAVVQAHGGRVLQYAGDNLLAAWGSQQALEDDAERAVQAGLALLALGRSLGAEVQREHGHEGFGVRVGLHYGPVLLGGGVNAEGSIRGLAVNVAARMEQSAPPGALRISQAVWRLVRGQFDATAQPPLVVKGVDAPVLSWLVQGPRAPRFADPRRAIDDAATPLVGRDTELQALQATWAQACATQRAAGWLVVGEAGLGKSRLLAEFQRRLQPAPAQVLRSRAHPQQQLRPFGTLRDWLFDAAGIEAADDGLQARAQLVALLGAEPAALLGQLIGLDFSDQPLIAGLQHDARQLRLRAFTAAQLALSTLAGGGPLLLLLDDAHWADDGSLDFVAALLAAAPAAPLLLLALARPALFERRPAWKAADWTGHTALNEMDASARQALAERLLAGFEPVPPALRQLLTEHGDGNPYFMEELLQALLERGAIERGADGAPWLLHAEHLRGLVLPPTLVGLLQARIDALPAAERPPLQQASVIGAEFWDEALAALDPQAPAALPALVARELVHERAPSRFEGTHEFGFHHHLLQQVAYDGLLRRHRQRHHLHAAQWLQQRAGTREGEYLALIAHHFEAAGEAEQAAAWWTRAAEAAAARDAGDAALAAAARAEALDAGRDDEAARRRAFAHTLVRVCIAEQRSEPAEQEARSLELLQQAQALDDDTLRARALQRRAWWLVQCGQTAEGLALAREAVTLADAARPAQAQLAARARGVATNALLMLNQPEAARALGEAALPLARAAADRTTEGQLLNSLALSWAMQLRLVPALALAREAMAVYARGGSRWGSLVAAGGQAAYLVELGQLEQAYPLLRQSIALSQEAGNRVQEVMARGSLARTLTELGRPTEAQPQLHAALALAAQLGNTRAEAFAHMAQSHTLLALHRFAQAREAALRANRIYRDAGSLGNAAGAQLFAAEALLGLGQPAAAATEVLALYEECREANVCQDEYVVQWGCAQMLLANGEPERAAPFLAGAHAQLMASAERVDDPVLRASFLDGLADRRALRAAYERSMRA
jgi:predicted ATPase/class 3 adenylate cyclase